MGDCNLNENCIYVPQALLDAVHSSGFRIELAETILLSWWMIDCWNTEQTRANRVRKWKRIHDQYFIRINKTAESRAKARRWLVDEGFIEIRQVVCLDGVTRNRRIKGKECQSYRTKNARRYSIYRLAKKSVFDCLPCSTASDEESKKTRENLGKLTRKSSDSGNLKEKKTGRQANRDQQTLLTLIHNKGVVKRGRVVNRLYSPWTGLRKELRTLFTLDGQEIDSFDLQAAQPTLMASMAGDTKMLADCQSDAFYKGLAAELGLEREDAKDCFYPYVYGPIRKVGTTQPQALKIQEWMRDKYETSAKFIDSRKTGRYYGLFSREMQNKEAAIFVDGIFRELNQRGVVVLTIHDSIFFGEKDREEVRAVTENHLRKHIKDGLFKIK